jgi:organic hydroperoxide reductase OsmC/OhrA
MATHVAAIKWAAKESGEDFLKGRFSRAHGVSFDGGTELPASASPHVVGKWAAEAAVDPEEMLVAALSSCHMLRFCISLASPASSSRPTRITPKG